MKYLLLTVLGPVLLSSCGGGAGTTNPTTNQPNNGGQDTNQTKSYRIVENLTYQRVGYDGSQALGLLDATLRYHYSYGYDSNNNLSGRNALTFSENFPEGYLHFDYDYIYSSINPDQLNETVYQRYSTPSEQGLGRLSREIYRNYDWVEGKIDSSEAHTLVYNYELGTINTEYYQTKYWNYDNFDKANTLLIDTRQDGEFDLSYTYQNTDGLLTLETNLDGTPENFSEVRSEAEYRYDGKSRLIYRYKESYSAQIKLESQYDYSVPGEVTVTRYYGDIGSNFDQVDQQVFRYEEGECGASVIAQKSNYELPSFWCLEW